MIMTLMLSLMLIEMTLLRPVTSRTTKNEKQDEHDGITLKVGFICIYFICFTFKATFHLPVKLYEVVR